MARDTTPSYVSDVGNPWTYAGGRLGSETGLLYLRNRYSNTAWGIFTSCDPVGDWHDTSSLGNGYTYGGNSPMIAFDPMGLEAGLAGASYQPGAGEALVGIYDVAGSLGASPSMLGGCQGGGGGKGGGLIVDAGKSSSNEDDEWERGLLKTAVWVALSIICPCFSYDRTDNGADMSVTLGKFAINQKFCDCLCRHPVGCEVVHEALSGHGIEVIRKKSGFNKAHVYKPDGDKRDIIEFNRNSPDPEGGTRPYYVGFAHELVHIYHARHGTYAGGIKDRVAGRWHEELTTVMDENLIRDELGVDHRSSYEYNGEKRSIKPGSEHMVGGKKDGHSCLKGQGLAKDCKCK